MNVSFFNSHSATKLCRLNIGLSAGEHDRVNIYGSDLAAKAISDFNGRCANAGTDVENTLTGLKVGKAE